MHRERHARIGCNTVRRHPERAHGATDSPVNEIEGPSEASMLAASSAYWQLSTLRPIMEESTVCQRVPTLYF
jgi:hypothetical protein